MEPMPHTCWGSSTPPLTFVPQINILFRGKGLQLTKLSRLALISLCNLGKPGTHYSHALASWLAVIVDVCKWAQLMSILLQPLAGCYLTGPFLHGMLLVNNKTSLFIISLFFIASCVRFSSLFLEIYYFMEIFKWLAYDFSIAFCEMFSFFVE